MLPMTSFLLTVSLSLISFAKETPFAKINPQAPQGGEFRFHLDADPTSLHPILAGDYAAWNVSLYTHDSLCASDMSTGQIIPKIAKSWSISPNGLEYTFEIRDNVYFHNDQLLTTEDVLFSFNAYRDPGYGEAFWLTFLQPIASVTLEGKNKVKFVFKQKYYKNLDILCSVQMLPKSVYGDTQVSLKILHETVGAGPYKLEKYQKGQLIVVKKFDKYYGNSLPEFRGLNNFKTVYFSISENQTVALEMLKKGDLDFLEIPSVENYIALTDGSFQEKIETDKFMAMAVENEMPWSIRYIGINQKDPILQDVKVRRALSLLIDRKEINQKMYHGLAEISNGPIPNYLPEASQAKPLEYNPKEAAKLLKSAGWANPDANGVLTKDIGGHRQRLTLQLLYTNPSSEKVLTTFQESLKKSGVKLELVKMERASFYKRIEQSEGLQLFMQAWSGQDRELDPRPRWHSTSSSKGGLNRLNYANPKVDQWIDEGRAELNPTKRRALFRKAYTQISEDCPAVFLFYDKLNFYGASKRIANPGPAFRYDFGVSSWWSKDAATAVR